MSDTFQYSTNYNEFRPTDLKPHAADPQQRLVPNAVFSYDISPHRDLWKTAAMRHGSIRPPALSRPASERSSEIKLRAGFSLGQLADVFCLAGHTGLVFRIGTASCTAKRARASAASSRR